MWFKTLIDWSKTHCMLYIYLVLSLESCLTPSKPKPSSEPQLRCPCRPGRLRRR